MGCNILSTYRPTWLHLWAGVGFQLPASPWFLSFRWVNWVLIFDCSTTIWKVYFIILICSVAIRNPTIRWTKRTTHSSFDRCDLVSCCTLSLRAGLVWSFGQCFWPCHRHSETRLLLIRCFAHHQSSRGFPLCSIWRINLLFLEYLGVLSLYIIVDCWSQRRGAFPRYTCSYSRCPFRSRNTRPK